MKRINKNRLIQVLSDSHLREMPPVSLSNEETEPSASFQRKMKSVFRKNRMRHRCRKLGKICAMFFLALLSTSILTLSFSSTARAELARWFKEKLRNDTVYRFLTNPEEDYQIPRYEAGWLPEGVKLIDRVETSNGYSRIYANTDESIIIILGVDKAQTGSHLQLTQMEGYSSETIFADGKTIEDYFLGERDRTLVWFEDEGRTMLTLDAFLSREAALRFIGSLREIE